jgi:hypothetical protein
VLSQYHIVVLPNVSKSTVPKLAKIEGLHTDHPASIIPPRGAPPSFPLTKHLVAASLARAPRMHQKTDRAIIPSPFL